MPYGGIPTIRHNKIRDINAILTEICHNVATEPALQKLDSETSSYRSANSDPNARLDIRTQGFWNRGQDTFFDIWVIHPNASSNYSTTIATTYRKNEQAKKGICSGVHDHRWYGPRSDHISQEASRWNYY